VTVREEFGFVVIMSKWMYIKLFEWDNRLIYSWKTTEEFYFEPHAQDLSNEDHHKVVTDLIIDIFIARYTKIGPAAGHVY